MKLVRVHAALVVVAVGAVACAATAPLPTPAASRESPLASASGSEVSSPSAEPSAEPSGRSASPFGLDLDIGRLDPAWTTPLLEVASDGDAVIFSSGVLDGTEAVGAPDLWRYVPNAAEPELLWRNPRRDRQLIRIGGDRSTWAFVDISVAGERAWDLWLLPAPGAEPILLDSHPGDEEVSSLVPSFVINEGEIAWTAFDASPNGPVSQLWMARGPDWHGELVAERRAAEAELWLPSLRASYLAYCEVRYAPDRATDERHVYLVDRRDPGAAPRRLDTSGLATMPLIHDDGVVWKETDRGFSMFNWGRLVNYDFDTQRITPLSTTPQEHVNYPSIGLRFVAAWGSDAFKLAVHDLDRGVSRRIATNESASGRNELRPHVSGDLLVWVHVETNDLGEGPPGEVRYAILPGAGMDRLED